MNFKNYGGFFMRQVLIILPIVLAVLIAIPISFRLTKGVKKRIAYQNSYAIQNIKTGKNIRVMNADYHDDVKTILYPHHNWECITWEFIQIEDSTFLLKNLYTQKTFEPMSNPKQGISLWQKPLGGSKYQYWDFLKQVDNSYLIRLKGTELYITISSDEDNSEIILMPNETSDKQKWKLIRQTPLI